MMKPGKTNKAFLKRIKITPRGKIMKRPSGQDHFNAKAPRTKQLGKKGWERFSLKEKIIRQYVPYA